MTLRRSRIIGTGSYLPSRVVTNDRLTESLDTTDTWIQQRTGIRQRHVAAEGERSSDLGIAAANRALDAAGLDTASDEIDLIIVATTTPDQTFPATAARIQAALGMTRGAAFDVQAVCSGFRLRAVRGRHDDADGAGEHGAGDRRRDVLPHS